MDVRLLAQLQANVPDISRAQVATWIAQGLVSVDGKIVTKPGQLVNDLAIINCECSQPKYVSRAGIKLEHALQVFKIDAHGKIILDAGLSTGGFTDCLLQNGALKIYGVDVGTKQVHAKIQANPRVQVMEQTDLRNLAYLPELVDLVTLDLSFISLLKVINHISKFLKPTGSLIVLIKPQFEVGKDHIGNSGIVKDAKIRDQAVKSVIAGIAQAGFILQQLTESPITGGDGNLEYLAHFSLV